jgi:hypothetical protein
LKEEYSRKLQSALRTAFVTSEQEGWTDPIISCTEHWQSLSSRTQSVECNQSCHSDISSGWWRRCILIRLDL